MSTNLRWDEFAEAVVQRLIRPGKGDPFLILGDTATDPGLAQACLAAGLRSGADTQLMIYKRIPWGEAASFSPVVLDAIRAARFIFGLHTNFCGQQATLEARQKGARVLTTQPWGIEDYLVSAFLDVDYDAMVRNGELAARLWNEADEVRITSEAGTDISFHLNGRQSIVGDGALTEDGEIDYFPGVQVSIAPVEDTINGRVVIDASDNVQGVLRAPYTMTIEKGVIQKLEGGLEASKMRSWLESRHDDVIWHLCHFTIGLNPKAGISGNMIEDERLLGSVDFGFGSQDPKFGGTVGRGPYHMDVILGSPVITLGSTVMIDRNTLNPELGFEPM